MRLPFVAPGLPPRETVLDVGGSAIRVRAYSPASDSEHGALSPTTLVWLHGGGFMFGDLDMPETHELALALCRRGVRVVSVEYTLAPWDALDAFAAVDSELRDLSARELEEMRGRGGERARFPAAMLEAVAVFDWVVESQALGPSARVALGGASAGAAIAAGAALKLRDRGSTRPTRMVLVHPLLHRTLPPASAAIRDSLPPLDDLLTFPDELVDAMNANYLGDNPDLQGYGFPGGHDLSGLPSTIIVTAEHDPLRASGEAFARELRAVTSPGVVEDSAGLSSS